MQTVTRSDFFLPHELQCKCGCGDGAMSAVFMGHADEFRRRVATSIVPSSAYRCPAHNSRVSSSGRTGPHTTRQAIDIPVRGHEAWRFMRIAMEMAVFTGIGVSQKGAGRFLHLDILPDGPGCPRPWVWSY